MVFAVLSHVSFFTYFSFVIDLGQASKVWQACEVVANCPVIYNPWVVKQVMTHNFMVSFKGSKFPFKYLALTAPTSWLSFLFFHHWFSKSIWFWILELLTVFLLFQVRINFWNLVVVLWSVDYIVIRWLKSIPQIFYFLRRFLRSLNDSFGSCWI